MPEFARRDRTEVRKFSPLGSFLAHESSGGILIVVATIVALVWANSPWSNSYATLWDTEFALRLGGDAFSLDLRHWLNDGLMTLFFFVVGLEIKREATSGHLASRKSLALPLFGALGGMAVPALIYLVVAGGTASKGWGIPMATDIALAVGLLAIAGRGVSTASRTFLLGLAVVDDIGAIIVIALFYSKGVSLGWLTVAACALVSIVVMRRIGVSIALVYVLPGVMLWFAMHEAGIHPTLAGVIVGVLTPTTPLRGTGYVDADDVAMGRDPADSVSVVEWLEHLVQPWSSFLIVPLFALANAGIEISTDALRSAVDSPVAWGVFLGLALGKPIGVGLMVVASTKFGIATRPDGATGRTILGLGTAAGIGFTVALFIAELAFTDGHADLLVDAKMAILAASVVSAVTSAVILRRPSRTA